MSGSFLSASWHRVSSLKPRLRSHVRVHRHRYQGRSWYVVEDDASGRLHRFSPSVYMCIGLMNGRRTVSEIWNEVVEQLGDDAPDQDELIGILSQLHGADLLQGDVAPDVAELMERRASQGKAMLKQRFANPLSIRVPLLDIDRFLERTVHLFAPLFGGIGLLVWLLVVGAGVTVAGMHWKTLSADATDTLLAQENLLVMALVFPILKAIHELGHGYAAKRFGGTVHELGLMLLILAPVPYVDASSASAFRSRWHRAMVGAAGMMAELFVAALAVFVWVWAEPGLARSVAYNTIMLAGITTVVFNANPLLKFDGYFIFCDLLGIPNLGNRSNSYWSWIVENKLFGVNVPAPQVEPAERMWFLLYAPAALIYRLSVTIGIAVFVATHYLIVGIVLGLVGIIQGLAWPILKGLGHVLLSSRLRGKRFRASLITFGGIAVLAGLLFLVPMPLHTNAQGVIWLPEQNFVRAAGDGFIDRLLVRPGNTVRPDQPLFSSYDRTIEAEIEVAEAEAKAAQAKLQSQEFVDRVQADITRQELDVKKAGVLRARQKRGDLVTRAKAEGTFLVSRADDMQGRFVKRGEILGYVTDGKADMIRAIVTQADVDLVRQRLTDISVLIPGQLGKAYKATILREVPAGSDTLPSDALSKLGGGQLVIDPASKDGPRTLERTFQFDIRLAEAIPGNFGSRVYIRFTLGGEPLGLQIYRRLRQSFLGLFNA